MKGAFGARVQASVTVRGDAPKANALVKSTWDIEHVRNGEVIHRQTCSNICTDEGLNALLDIMFHATTQITTWYVAIVETNTSPAAGMTYAVPTYTESTAYAEATRPAFVEAAASGKSMTNSANKAVFTINATKTIYGAALVGGGSAATTKADVAGGGTLYCYSLFSSSRAVVATDVLNVTVTLTSADA